MVSNEDKEAKAAKAQADKDAKAKEEAEAKAKADDWDAATGDDFKQVVEGEQVAPAPDAPDAVVVAPAGDEKMTVPATEVDKYESLGFTVERGSNELNPHGTLTDQADPKYVKLAEQEAAARNALVELLGGKR